MKARIVGATHGHALLKTKSDALTVQFLLKSCSRASEVSQIHAVMIKTGLSLLTFPLSTLLASSILDINYARSIFDRIQHPNLFNFNTMLRGYSVSEEPRRAFSLFNSLRARGISLDQFSFITTLKSCASEAALYMGECIHGLVVGSGFEFFLNLRNTLIRFYCACGRIRDARQVFDEFHHIRDVVSWNVLMGGYLLISRSEDVTELFRRMHVDGCEIGCGTIVSVLMALGNLGDLLGGESLHVYSIKNGFCLDTNVVTAFLSMYGKSGCMTSARRLFDEIHMKDVVMWNCIIDGYAKHGRIEESLDLLRLMKIGLAKPNSATFAGLLSACASSGALTIGRCIHACIEDEFLELDPVLGTSLINMYSKCGSIEKAKKVFDRMQSKDVMSWTTMIDGFGVHGRAREALQLFVKMEMEGVAPNEVTFLAVLNACSHGGLVKDGKEFFVRMIREYEFLPKIEHYGCMIDLLGRAGLLVEAYELIKSLPVEHDATAWRALLAACRVHGNVELGELVKSLLMELDDKHPTDLILMQSTYATAGRWNEIAANRHSLEEKVTKKKVGWSAIEMDC